MKLWKKILIRTPKVGLAYRAYRWFRFVRRYKLVKVAKLARRLRRGFKQAKEEGVHDMKGALQSKTIWGIILMAVSFIANQFFGVIIDEGAALDLIMEIVSYVGLSAGTLLGYYGRMKAVVQVKGLVQ